MWLYVRKQNLLKHVSIVYSSLESNILLYLLFLFTLPLTNIYVHTSSVTLFHEVDKYFHTSGT